MEIGVGTGFGADLENAYGKSHSSKNEELLLRNRYGDVEGVYAYDGTIRIERIESHEILIWKMKRMDGIIHKMKRRESILFYWVIMAFALLGCILYKNPGIVRNWFRGTGDLRNASAKQLL